MAIQYTDTCIHNQLDEITALIDAGAGAGIIRIYDGTKPADADTAITGTLLAQLTCTDPVAAAASGNALTFSSITADSSADATGTASHFRVLDSNANTVMQGDVGTSGSDLNLDSVSITSGDNVAISSFVITGGNG